MITSNNIFETPNYVNRKSNENKSCGSAWGLYKKKEGTIGILTVMKIRAVMDQRGRAARDGGRAPPMNRSSIASHRRRRDDEEV
jgi:hypothetical protein